MKIIDCFIFYNELDLLNYRLNILNNYVDYFVIVESTHTFVGKEKPLFFDGNQDMFTSFKEKIIHIIVDDLPYKYPNINFRKKQQWLNEYFQRNSISLGIDNIKDLSDSDVLIISDSDEIPNPLTLGKIKKGLINVDFITLLMDMYYYNLNTRLKTKWPLCKIISYQKYKEFDKNCNTIRNKIPNVAILDGGWHLSFFGDANFIKNKITSFSHNNYNKDEYTDLVKIDERIENFRDIFDRNDIDIEKIEIINNDYLPVEYDKYLHKYYSYNETNI